jgi:glyoxylase-like metal-dependent hydrolase (beta-lactamase superfamily II)
MKQIIPGLWDIDEVGDAVHCYLFEWKGGLTLIDTGLPTSITVILDALVSKGLAYHSDAL